MAFSGEIHHGIRLIFLKQPAQRGAFADTLLFEGVMRVADGAGEGLQVGGIGQLVDVDDAGMRVSRRRCRMTAEPMKPAPPVMKMVAPLNLAMLLNSECRMPASEGPGH